jgi:hypothetical protein
VTHDLLRQLEFGSMHLLRCRNWPSFLRYDQFLSARDLLQATEITVLIDADYANMKKVQADAMAYAKSVGGPAEAAARQAREAAFAQEKQAREERLSKREDDAVAIRKAVRIGAETNCGTVFDVRLPMVGIQTSNGMQYIRLDRLYAAGAGCVFQNGQYVGPGDLR